MRLLQSLILYNKKPPIKIPGVLLIKKTTHFYILKKTLNLTLQTLFIKIIRSYFNAKF